MQKVTFYGSTLVDNGTAANGKPLEIPGASKPGMVTKAGLVLFGNDGKSVRTSRTDSCVCEVLHTAQLLDTPKFGLPGKFQKYNPQSSA